jgi:glycosyltransferase A (GT-A) superfamily protein (DUF2064 family)
MKNQILILFSKYPKKDAKTRIRKYVGSVITEKFCFACIDDITIKMKQLKGTDTIIVSDTFEDSELFCKKYGIKSISIEEMQIPLVLSKSEKFHGIFKYFLRKYSKVVLIPMDVPHLSLSEIEVAFNRLDPFNSVFGPEYNGGVYLMGLRELSKNTFKEVKWSTEESFSDLIKNNPNSFVLEESFDLNTIQDLKLLTPGKLARCPHLTRFINSFILGKLTELKEVITA